MVLSLQNLMFGKLEVHALEVVWRFKPITFYIGSLRVKLILAPHGRFSKQKQPTPYQTHVELKDNSNVTNFTTFFYCTPSLI